MGAAKRGRRDPPEFEIVADAVAHARGIGLSHNQPEILKDVHRGTNKDVWTSPGLNVLVRDACYVWIEEYSPAIAAKLEELMMDGRDVVDFVCRKMGFEKYGKFETQ